MEEKIGNILYSLIPLILIIVFSWLFGRLGAKMRKQGQEGEAVGEKEREFQLIDLFAADKESPGPTATQLPGAERQPEFMQPSLGASIPGTTAGGPVVTPKPIEPKMWGA
jgi:hypothetical protein